MNRGSDKVPARIDEQLDQETASLQQGSPVSSRAEDFREQEGADEEARHLQPSAFPADRDRLIQSAREMNAPQGIIELLEQAPEGRRFASVQEIWEALGLPDPQA